METLSVNVSGRPRRTMIDGREHIVVPLTSIVPGVLNGSKGALYYPPDEIKQSIKAWDGMPLVVYHPMAANGNHVSASSPGILDKQGVGFVRKSAWSGKLVHEGCFDVERTKSVDPRVLNALERGEKIELSTGLFTDNEQAHNGANHNGKGYEWVARNYRPDHIAILPDQVGACSVRDGCGVMVNELSVNSLTDNAWTDAAREASAKARGAAYASGESRFTGHEEGAAKESAKATTFSRMAHQSSVEAKGSKSGHFGAMRAHEAAADQQGKAAESQRASGDEITAKAHERAAEGHRAAAREHSARAGVANANPEGNNQYTAGGASAGARKASASAARATASTESGAADKAGAMKLFSKSREDDLTSADHEKLAQRHAAFADRHGSQGHEEAADAHHEASKAHAKAAAMKEDKQRDTRDQLKVKSDEAGEHSMAALTSSKSGSMSGSPTAALAASDQASKHAEDGNYAGAAKAHREASMYHADAARQSRRSGDNKAADAHEKASDSHQGAYESHDVAASDVKRGVRNTMIRVAQFVANAKRCPECGGRLDEDGECEECGYTENAGGGDRPVKPVKAVAAGSTEALARQQQQAQKLAVPPPAAQPADNATEKRKKEEDDEECNMPSIQNSNPEGHNQYTAGGAGSLKSATDKAKNASREAHEAGTSKAHGAAVDAHYEAGAAHMDAAREATKAGDHAKAAALYATASKHAKASQSHSDQADVEEDKGLEEHRTHDAHGRKVTKNMKVNAMSSDPTVNEHEGHYFGDKSELTGESHTKDAMAATEKAKEKGTSKSHTAAAKAHGDAAEAHEDLGNDDTAAQHRGMAKHHRMMAGKAALTGNEATMTKEQRIEQLIANGCACEGDRQALNSLSQQALNAFGKKKKDEDDEDEDEDDEDMRRNDGTSMHSFDSGGKGSSDQAGGKGAKDEYSANRAFSALPREVQEDIRYGREMKLREKESLVNKLIANVEGDSHRRATVKYLEAKSLGELRVMAGAFAPRQPVQGPYDRQPSYFGAAAADPTVNVEDDQTDILPLPTMNWAAEAATGS